MSETYQKQNAIATSSFHILEWNRDGNAEMRIIIGQTTHLRNWMLDKITRYVWIVNNYMNICVRLEGYKNNMKAGKSFSETKY